MFVVHDSKFSLLNFCSSERIVREGDEDIGIGVKSYVSQSLPSLSVYELFKVLAVCCLS